MPKRKADEMTASCSGSSLEQLLTQPIQEKKRAKRQSFKLGDAVSVSYRWTSRIRYSYWAWTRHGQKTGFLSDSGKGTFDFQNLSRNWKEQIRDKIIKENQSDWQYRIYHKEKFWWNYESWKVKLRQNIRLNSIQVKDLNAIDLSSDASFSD